MLTTPHPKHTYSRTRIAIACCSAVLAGLTLGGCDRPPPKAGATQVAAKVGDDEITVHQLNFVLERSRAPASTPAEVQKKQALETLIDQQLMMQQALESKLDRSPQVTTALEAARREVLVQAYVEQLLSAQSKPSDTEARKFYAENPDLFANRKVYRLEEVNFPSNPEAVAKVKALAAQGRSLEEIINQLRADGVQASGGVGVKAAEQLPLKLLPLLAKAPEGQPQFVQDEQQSHLVSVQASKSAPVEEAQAIPMIQEFLLNQKKSESVKETLKQLRAKAAIEYQGEFASPAKAGTP